MKIIGRIVMTALASATVSNAFGETITATEGWAAMTKCASLTDERARHRCSDDVMRRGGLLASAPLTSSPSLNAPTAPSAASTSVTSAPAAGAATTGAPAAASAPSATRASAPASVPSDYGLQKPKERAKTKEAPVDVTLAKVDSLDGKLVLTTTDNAVWRQSETQAIRPGPQPGQVMTISRTAFGGFLCKPEKLTAFRCIRSR